MVHICSDINLDEQRCIALENLALYKDHLYVMSGSSQGIVERLVVKEMEEEAVKYMQLFSSLFGDHYYLMIQNHRLKLQQSYNERLISIAKYTKVKIVCSNEVRYLKRSDALALDLMQATLQGTVLDYQYMPMTEEKYLKTYIFVYYNYM